MKSYKSSNKKRIKNLKISKKNCKKNWKKIKG